MSKNTTKKKVLIVDDHAVLRGGLSQVIGQQEDLEVCGEAESAPDALTAIDTLMPDVAIVDLSLASGSGLELIKEISARFPKLPVVVLSMHDETLYASRALKAGALGYVMKKESTEHVISALRKVLDGGYALSDNMIARMMGTFVRGKKPLARSPVDLLSDRELEVFQLLGQGHSTREIAKVLHLSIKTVSAYRENIKQKLKLKSANELVRHAIHWATLNYAE